MENVLETRQRSSHSPHIDRGWPERRHTSHPLDANKTLNRAFPLQFRYVIGFMKQLNISIGLSPQVQQNGALWALDTVIVVELQRSETLRLRPASKDRETSTLRREKRGLAC